MTPTHVLKHNKMEKYERTLDEILANWHYSNRGSNPEFHGRKEVERLMIKHNGFHDKDNTWLVRTKAYVYIFHVWYGPETSMFPQSENNEIGHIEYCFRFPIESFASALQIMMKDNYDDILRKLKP